MIIIDGDDYLIKNNALSIINKRYLDTNCFGTFGSYIGKFDKMKYKVNMKTYSRKNWFYMAPRTCKCFLLENFTINDFKYEKKEWLKKACIKENTNIKTALYNNYNMKKENNIDKNTVYIKNTIKKLEDLKFVFP
jgi:hypothetical protein